MERTQPRVVLTCFLEANARIHYFDDVRSSKQFVYEIRRYQGCLVWLILRSPTMASDLVKGKNNRCRVLCGWHYNLPAELARQLL